MQIVDFDEEQRRAEQHTDMSRMATVLFALALSLVLGFAALMFWLERS